MAVLPLICMIGVCLFQSFGKGFVGLEEWVYSFFIIGIGISILIFYLKSKENNYIKESNKNKESNSVKKSEKISKIKKNSKVGGKVIFGRYKKEDRNDTSDRVFFT